MAWGYEGHGILTELAWARLSPATRQEMDDLLEGLTPAKASIWLDEVRRQRRETMPWHYVNIPISQSRYDPDRDCPKTCVVSEIARSRAILADRTRPKADRAEALKVLMHLVGDIHQPLHVADDGDRGGNDTRIFYRGRVTNLHALWDYEIMKIGLSDPDWQVQVRLPIRPEDAAEWTTLDPVKWARKDFVGAKSSSTTPGIQRAGSER